MTLYNYIELLPSLWKSWYDTAPDRWFGSSRPQNSSVTFTSLIWKIAYFSSPNSFKGTGSINTSALNALKAVKKKIKEKCKATYQVNAKAVFGCMWGRFFYMTYMTYYNQNTEYYAKMRIKQCSLSHLPIVCSEHSISEISENCLSLQKRHQWFFFTFLPYKWLIWLIFQFHFYKKSVAFLKINDNFFEMLFKKSLWLNCQEFEIWILQDG